MTDPCEILRNSRRIAVLGMSPNLHRTSHEIAEYLDSVGFETVYVNPNYPEIAGKKCYAGLADVPGEIDIVDVFRAAEHEHEVADEILAMPRRPRAVWYQLNAGGDAAAGKLQAAGIEVFVNSCIKVVHSLCAATS
jgi:predicted CoA-binding protein